MLKKTITYKDYNGNSRTEDFYFNLNKAELAEMQLSINGGLNEQLKQIIQSQDNAFITRFFKDLILKSYGEKSLDGKYFIKINENGVPLSRFFMQSEAYAELFYELASGEEKCAAFVNGIIEDAVSDLDAAKKETA